jgi:hypothetical protein
MKRIQKCFYLAFFLLLAGKANSQSTGINIIHLKKFTAYEKGDHLSVQWTTNGLVATNYFEVQRSEDGKAFRTIAIVLGPDPKQAGDNYEYVEKMNSKNDKLYYYRLCHVDETGAKQPTHIIVSTK